MFEREGERERERERERWLAQLVKGSQAVKLQLYKAKRFEITV